MGGDAVAGGQRVVGEGLGAVDEHFVIVGGEEEAAVLRVFEVAKENLCEIDCEVEMVSPPLLLEQRQNRVDEKGVVVEVGGEAGAPVLVGGTQAAVLPQVFPEEVERAPRGFHEARLRQDAPRHRHPLDHERVPRGQHLVVAPRPDALRPDREQGGAGTLEDPLDFRHARVEAPGKFFEFREHVQMPVPAFEVGGTVETEARREHRVVFLAEQTTYLLGFPDVELALLAFGVGVQGGVVAPLGRLHLPHRPLAGLRRHLAEQILAGGLPGLGAEDEEGAVVVEHLLEVRDHPLLVHGVAAEASPEVVVDAPEAHLAQRVRRHRQGEIVPARGARGGGEGPHQGFDVRRMRELRRRSEPPVLGVEGAREQGPRVFERPRRHDFVAFRLGFKAAQRFDQRLGLLAQLAATLGVEVADPAQDVLEGRQAEARGPGKVGAAEEGNAVLVVEEHRQRPAPAAPGEQVLRALVDLVEVRALFAVDLDVDEEPVHELRGIRILEGLVRHHVAPVARGVAHRQQDRLPLAGRPLQCLLPPRIPVDRVVGVLKEIGARLGREPVQGLLWSASGGASQLGGHSARRDYIGGAAGLPLRVGSGGAMLKYPEFDPVAVQVGPLAVHWYGLMYVVAFGLGWWLGRVRAPTPPAAGAGATWTTCSSTSHSEWSRADASATCSSTTRGGSCAIRSRSCGSGRAACPFTAGSSGSSWRCCSTRGAARVPSSRSRTSSPPSCRSGSRRVGWETSSTETSGAGPANCPGRWCFRAPASSRATLRSSTRRLLEGVALFALLWWFSRRPRPVMATSGLFLLAYAVFRSAVEFVRVPDRQYGYLAFDWLTMGQVLCLPMALAGAWLLWRARPSRPDEGSAAGSR